MKRNIETSRLKKAVYSLISDISYSMPEGADTLFKSMRENEKSDSAKDVMSVLIENSELSKQENLPLCQDCGSVVVFTEIGQDIILKGNFIDHEINSAVEEAYEKLFLRKSIVADPLKRINTGTNTPAFIHHEIVPGNSIKLTVYLKGGGSENMSVLKMFRPTDSIETIIDFIEKSVVNAGPNPCPPLFLGIGLGGTADIAMVNAKKAILRGIGNRNRDPYYSALEVSIAERLNMTNIGPLGFGGLSTVAEVYIMQAPCHIASLPVAINMNCHSIRYKSVTI